MKIRKTVIAEKTGETNVYIYENKKEEYTVVSVPDIEWSIYIPYEEDFASLKARIYASLQRCVNEESAEGLKERIYQWICEM